MQGLGLTTTMSRPQTMPKSHSISRSLPMSFACVDACGILARGIGSAQTLSKAAYMCSGRRKPYV
jgi:hypothetical protein